MNFKPIEEKIIQEVEFQLKPYRFELLKLDLEKDHYADFVLEDDEKHFVFGFRFLLYEKHLSIEPKIFVSYDIITQLVKKVIPWESDYYNGWLAISSRLGVLLNPKNKDGFYNDNDCVHIEVTPTEKGIEQAVSILMNKFFKLGALTFIENTNSLFRIDALINGWVLKNAEPLKSLAYFGSHRPWQITTGIIVAKMVERPDFSELLERYSSFAKTKDPNVNEWIKDFYSFVEYFKKMDA